MLSEVSPLAAVVRKITMHFEDTKLSTGTGFFWRGWGNRRDVYLITNWHNCSGKDQVTGKHLSPTLAEPCSIEIRIHMNRGVPWDRVFRIPLYSEERVPVWIEHPTFANKIDVVALRLPQELRPLRCLNEILGMHEMLVEPGCEVFVLGYPLGLDIGDTPLWKRGTIASEPMIDVDGLPLFLVDTATTKGMSGSPVIMQANQAMMEDGAMNIKMGSPMTRFLGIYSGRVASVADFDAQLARIWKPHMVEEIVQHAESLS